MSPGSSSAGPLSRRGVAKLLPALFGVLPLLYDADLYAFSILPKLALLQTFVFLVAVLWAYDVSRGQIGWHLPDSSLPAVCFIFLSGVSACLADHSVFEATAFFSRQTAFFLLFLLVSQTADANAIKKVMTVVCGTGIVVSLIGISEFWGLDAVSIPSNGRPSSTFAYRNFAAAYLIAALPIAAVVTFRAAKRAEFFLGLLATLLMALFLVYTRSRGAWLGGLAGAAFTAALLFKWHSPVPTRSISRSRQGRMCLAAGFLLFVCLAPWSPQVAAPGSRAIDENKTKLLDAMSSLASPGASRGRWTLWSGSLSMIGDHPFLGVGPDNWKLAYPAYDDGKMIQVGSAPERPHNDYLWIASESGILALAAFLWFMAAALKTGISVIRRKDENAWIAASIVCGLISVWVHALFSFPRERIESSLFLWCGPAFLHLLDRSPHRKAVPRGLVPALLPIVAAATLAITVLEIRFDRALLRGLQALAAGDTVGLSRSTSEGLAAGPFDSRIFLLQNKVFQSQGNYKGAQEACLTGLRYHPNSPELKGDLGMVYAMDGNLVAAEKALLESIHLAPSHHQAYNNLGGVYQQWGAFDKAHEAYAKAVAAKPDYVDAHSNLGLLNKALGDYNAAISNFDTALKFANADPSLHHNLADAYYARNLPGDDQKALSHYQTFLRTWRGNPAESRTAHDRVREILRAP